MADILGTPLYAFLTTWPLVITFFICTFITFRSYLRTKNRTSLYFTLSFLSFAITYLIWGIRVSFIAPDAPKNEFYWYWIWVYLLGGAALVFIDAATLQFLKTGENNKLIAIFILLIATSFFGVMYLLFTGFATKELILSDVNDLDIDDWNIKIYLFISMGIYIMIPNIIFLRFLKYSEKGSFVSKKVKILEYGIILVCIGMGLDGIRIANNFGMTLIRWLVLLGGLVLIAGLSYRQKTTPNQK